MVFFLLGGGGLELVVELGSFFSDPSSLSPSLSLSVKMSGNTKRDRQSFRLSEERLHDESSLSSLSESKRVIRSVGGKPLGMNSGGRGPLLSLELIELDMVCNCLRAG